MSKATMDLHHNIKKPGSIIFTAFLAFIGTAIFPGGLILGLGIMGIHQYLFHLPDIILGSMPLVFGVLGLFAALYSILSDISENMDIHKMVIIELLSNVQEIKTPK